jgi:hypothetical protein
MSPEIKFEKGFRKQYLVCEILSGNTNKEVGS